MSGDSRLYLACTPRDGRILVTAVGAIDRHTVLQLRSMLLPALTRIGPCAVLDLSAVDRLDEVGVEALRRTARRATELGGYLRLAAPHPDIQDVIRENGLAWSMHISRTVQGALDGPARSTEDADRADRADVMASA